MTSPVIFDTDHAFKRQNTIFLTKKLFIKFSMMHRSRLVLFFQGKSLCFGTRQQVACEVLIVWRSWLKKWYLRFYLTQIIHSNSEMLFFQPKDCLSKFLWCAALVKLFFLQGKVCVLWPCISKSLARCLSFKAFRRPPIWLEIHFAQLTTKTPCLEELLKQATTDEQVRATSMFWN